MYVASRLSICKVHYKSVSLVATTHPHCLCLAAERPAGYLVVAGREDVDDRKIVNSEAASSFSPDDETPSSHRLDWPSLAPEWSTLIGRNCQDRALIGREL